MSIVIAEDKIPFIDLGDGYKVRLEYEDLTDEKYIEKAKNELRETPDVVKNAVEELRQLITSKYSNETIINSNPMIGVDKRV